MCTSQVYHCSRNLSPVTSVWKLLEKKEWISHVDFKQESIVLLIVLKWDACWQKVFMSNFFVLKCRCIANVTYFRQSQNCISAKKNEWKKIQMFCFRLNSQDYKISKVFGQQLFLLFSWLTTFDMALKCWQAVVWYVLVCPHPTVVEWFFFISIY